MAEKPLPDMDAALAVVNAICKREDYMDAIATATKKQFDALLRAGFTDEQATRIIAGFATKSDR